MTKEQELSTRQKLHELLDIALDTNGFQHRTRSQTGTLPTVFLEYSGHVQLVDFTIHEDGWEAGSYGKHFRFYLDDPISDKTVEAIKSACQAALTDKTETDVLMRDIEKQKENIADQKKKLSDLRKSLRKAQKRQST